MNEQSETAIPYVKLALDRKLISPDQLELCKSIAKKSRKIGLETSVEEVLISKGFLTPEQVHELSEISQLTDDGKIFGAYRMAELIGEGGMGKVYRAVHEFMGRNVAIKVINASVTNDKTNATRFFQEIRALAKLKHPNIVTIYDAGRINRHFYFAMELLPGPSLKVYVDSKKMLAEHEALSVIRATAQALGHAHANSVVHRDVKPENIIFDAGGSPKITDFGLVMHHDIDHMTLTQEGCLVGSFYYTSPEQVDGNRDIDGRADIYSLGATLYYALTGRTVYTGNSPQELLTKHLTGNFVSPKKYNPRISRATVRLLRKMLAVKRERRFQSMEDVVAAIDGRSWRHKAQRIAIYTAAGVGLFLIGMLVEYFRF
ncbi:MAG TPA: serine/threonine-protein kinase [Chitinivibrionales bacterium]|jgi:serine/threonine-protein kinase|nr:serine/threonine-protein kinase [Chitinivibrionales bacterium]